MHTTSRQREILCLLVRGLSDKAIASRLSLSRGTVRTHLQKLFDEHGVHSRAAVVGLWLRQLDGNIPVAEPGEQLSALGQELAAASASFAQEFWTLNGQVLKVLRSHGDPAPVTYAMRALVSRFLAEVAEFQESRRDVLDEAELSHDGGAELNRTTRA